MTNQRRDDPPTRGSRRVLVVAAEAAIRDLARRTLEDAGFVVLTADNSAAALNLVTTSAMSVDMLITTVPMPGLSGPSLAAELVDRLPNLRVVYVAASIDVAAEGRDFLYPPLTPVDLLRKVNAVLDR